MEGKGHTTAALSIPTSPWTCKMVSVRFEHRVKTVTRLSLLIGCKRCKGHLCIFSKAVQMFSKLVLYSFINVFDCHNICEHKWKTAFLFCTFKILLCLSLKSNTLGFMLDSGELFRLNPSRFVQLISFTNRLDVQPFSSSLY